ncbi:AMIN-like domain-containing (lipo)protein [Streptomyces lavendulae]|uniref:AMIN-like domain-containing (lipo)protein n=1 Tax=Streptomyces lavendulae TaxID=1914 RepID=UPI00340D41D9
MRHLNRLRRRRTVALATGALLTAGLALAAPASAAASAAPSARTLTPLVVNARWGGHCTYDRIVIDLQGSVPPVTVTPVPQLVYDGSGKPVPLAGKYFLEIRLHPAAGHDDAGQNVYQGPKLQKISLSKLKGLALTGDYEGYVTFGAAFDTKPAFTTSVLHSPERYVVDVAHPNTC